MFTTAELDRARARTWDPRIADALEKAGSYGHRRIPGRGPQKTAPDLGKTPAASSRGPHARGARAGRRRHRRPAAPGWDLAACPRDLLTQAHEHYLTGPRARPHPPAKPLDQAWDWATQQRDATTALLRPDPANPGMVDAFDYLVDTVQRRDGPPGPSPRTHHPRRHPLRQPGPTPTPSRMLPTPKAATSSPNTHSSTPTVPRPPTPPLGAEHPNALASRSNLARVLGGPGAAGGSRGRAPRRPGTASPGFLGGRATPNTPDRPQQTSPESCAAWGRLEEAEAELARPSWRFRTGGPGRRAPPTPLASRSKPRRSPARPGGGWRKPRAELRARPWTAAPGVLGAEHPRQPWPAAANLAGVLRGLGAAGGSRGRAPRAALDGLTRVLGAEHPDTLIGRRQTSPESCATWGGWRKPEGRAARRPWTASPGSWAPSTPDNPEHPAATSPESCAAMADQCAEGPRPCERLRRWRYDHGDQLADRRPGPVSTNVTASFGTKRPRSGATESRACDPRAIASGLTTVTHGQSWSLSGREREKRPFSICAGQSTRN